MSTRGGWKNPRAAKYCANCKKRKGDHKRILGVLLCPHLLSRRDLDTKLFHVIYQEMEAPALLVSDIVPEPGKVFVVNDDYPNLENPQQRDEILFGPMPDDYVYDITRQIAVPKETIV